MATYVRCDKCRLALPTHRFDRGSNLCHSCRVFDDQVRAAGRVIREEVMPRIRR